jgi:hypothetical protein
MKRRPSQAAPAGLKKNAAPCSRFDEIQRLANGRNFRFPYRRRLD